MISYDGLIQKLNEAELTKTALAKELNISSRTIAKIAKGEKIANRTLEKIATYFGCEITDLYRSISQNALLQKLRDEKSIKLPGGLYHELQIRMTYNSNHMEGSTLSESQTRFIFETSTINAPNGVPVDDVIETVNHFRAIDYVIDCAEEPLTESIIKQLHSILKQGTKDAAIDWFAVGEYKRIPNLVGGKQTTKPKDVSKKMNELLECYEAIISETKTSKVKTSEAENNDAKPNETNNPISIYDIIEFHYKFERIHPFQDGNGRVGRLVAFKECLRHNIVPFIIEDSKKMFYYRGLSEWTREKGYLTDTCLDGQDTFKKLLIMFNE